MMTMVFQWVDAAVTARAPPVLVSGGALSRWWALVNASAVECGSRVGDARKVSGVGGQLRMDAPTPTHGLDSRQWGWALVRLRYIRMCY